MVDQRKTVLITGCTTGGIGEAFAKEFHRRGLRVFATSRSLATMPTLDALGIETLPLDIADIESIRQAKTIISERTGGTLNILINNAGIAYASSVSDLSMVEVRKLFDVNLFGHMAMTHEFLPLLLAASDACVVMVASLAGMMPVPYNSAYNASKAALLSFGDTLRVELSPFGVRVINIAAGNVESNIMKGSPNSLPENSIYYPVNKEFVRDRIENFQKGAIPTDEFARTVVSEALKSHPRAWVLTAKNAWTVWIISTFMGRRGFDGILSRIFGLAKLAEIKKAERKKRLARASL